jgi:hypothetical protein
MAANTVKPDYSTPQRADEGFRTPLDESMRWSTEREIHFEQERRQSGNLPDQPDGLEVNATPGNPRPVRF